MDLTVQEINFEFIILVRSRQKDAIHFWVFVPCCEKMQHLYKVWEKRQNFFHFGSELNFRSTSVLLCHGEINSRRLGFSIQNFSTFEASRQTFSFYGGGERERERERERENDPIFFGRKRYFAVPCREKRTKLCYWILLVRGRGILEFLWEDHYWHLNTSKNAS